jgi:ssRNA-specific RNase YbeY (16S rRNA maturation enzyme)
VTSYQIQGKRVHDARLVAVMLVHGVTHLLTFNPDDFRSINEIVVVNPEAIANLETDRISPIQLTSTQPTNCKAILQAL